MPLRFPLPVLLATVLLLSACSEADRPAAIAPSAPPPASVEPSAAEDVPGATACGALAAAISDATLMNPGVVEAITAASTTADAPITDAASRLSDAYAKALASAGTEAEPDAVAAVSAAGAEMSTVCGESGLDTVG